MPGYPHGVVRNFCPDQSREIECWRASEETCAALSIEQLLEDALLEEEGGKP